MKGYYSKKLQNNSSLYQELQENIKFYINHSTFAHKPKLFFSVNPEHVNNLF